MPTAHLSTLLLLLASLALASCSDLPRQADDLGEPYKPADMKRDIPPIEFDFGLLEDLGKDGAEDMAGDQASDMARDQAPDQASDMASDMAVDGGDDGG